MESFVIERELIPELEGTWPGRTGRHINHDSRSKSFRTPKATTQVSKKWARQTPTLNQGDLGSCTGNSSCGVLGTDPFFPTLADKIKAGLKLDEPEAVNIYGLATQLDSYAGQYPPTDTGSDGLSAAKACQKLGFISGYTHALSMDDFINGMQNGPAISGTNWYTGMDSPDANGLVTVTGNVRGGHEFEADELDMENELVGFINSWGTWGLNGTGKFYIKFSDFEKLLSQQGDATFFVPLDQPAPTPTPAPDSQSIVVDGADLTAMNLWAKNPHLYHNASVAAQTWRKLSS